MLRITLKSYSANRIEKVDCLIAIQSIKVVYFPLYKFCAIFKCITFGIGISDKPFFVFDRANYLTLAASLLGVTSLIFNAKGNPFGQFLMIVFSVLYGVISYTFSYYGEMITYLGMTAPMAVFALFTWLKNPYNGNKAQVKVHQMHKKEAVWAILLTAAVTAVFYFILEAFHTANLLPSTISVATSFLAAYLTFRRSPYFALAYAANDLVLIWLWILAAITDISYLSVIVCFILFFANDLYGFYSWKRMQKQQNQSASEKH